MVVPTAIQSYSGSAEQSTKKKSIIGSAEQPASHGSDVQPTIAKPRIRQLSAVNGGDMDTASVIFQCSDTTNVVEILEHLFRHNAESVDRNTWCHCRTASKNVKTYVMESQCRNTKIYRARQTMALKLDEAAQIAQQIISPRPWSPADPRCCSLHCRNSFNAQTGIWSPPLVVLSRESPENVRIVENQWWRNNLSARRWYIESSPQTTLMDLMQDMRNRQRESQIKVFYVACSEGCLHDVKQALNSIHWRNPEEFDIFLGVDKIFLEN